MKNQLWYSSGFCLVACGRQRHRLVVMGRVEQLAQRVQVILQEIDHRGAVLVEKAGAGDADDHLAAADRIGLGEQRVRRRR